MRWSDPHLDGAGRHLGGREPALHRPAPHTESPDHGSHPERAVPERPLLCHRRRAHPAGAGAAPPRHAEHGGAHGDGVPSHGCAISRITPIGRFPSAAARRRSGDDPRTLDGAAVRPRVAVLLDRPLPGLRRARRTWRGRRDVLRRVDPVHRRRGDAGLALTRRAALGAVGGRCAVRGHVVLQRDDVRGDAHAALEPRVRPAGLASRRARVDLLPRLGRDRLRRLAAARMAAAARRARLVGAGRQPPGLHLLRDLRRGGVRGARYAAR